MRTALKTKCDSGVAGRMAPWKVVKSRTVFDVSPWISVEREEIRLPDGAIVDDFYSIKLQDYAMVCAVDGAGRYLMVRQYKHALRRTAVSFPVGCLEVGESPWAAAKRELLEETGYVARDWWSYGTYVVDGSRKCSTAHFFIARRLQKRREPQAGTMELTQPVFLRQTDIVDMMVKADRNLLASASLLALVTNPYLCRRMSRRIRNKTVRKGLGRS